MPKSIEQKESVEHRDVKRRKGASCATVESSKKDGLPKISEQKEISYSLVFWQELFSAVTMLIPSITVFLGTRHMTDIAASPPVLWCRRGIYAHCPVAIAYHMSVAFGKPLLRGWYRFGDLATIHVNCVIFGWALSHGSVQFTQAIALLNGVAVILLIKETLSGKDGGPHQTLRILVGVILYLSAMLYRGDVTNFLGASMCWTVAAILFFVSRLPRFRLQGWGHGFFHIALGPFGQFLLWSAAKNDTVRT